MDIKELLYKYCLRIADNNLILSHRLCEMSSNAPLLEEDIALSNIALDLLGQATEFYQYAAELEGKGRTEDELAYKRTEREYYNFLLAEQPNTNFAYVLTRQFFIDVYHYGLFQQLSNSADQKLSALAAKSLKEVRYHMRHSGQWLIRLGNGTEESRIKVQDAVNSLWKYTKELHETDEVDIQLSVEGIAADSITLEKDWKQLVESLFEKAKIKIPTTNNQVSGSKKGVHTEYLGHLLSDMQYLQRSFPEASW